MNTYRVYLLSTGNPLEPVATVCYIRAEKYGPAWQISRGVARGDEKYAKQALYTDPDCTQKLRVPAESVVAKIDDIRPRNVKLDKKALQELVNNPETPAEEKVEALRQLLKA